jgi:hypothetical protein
MDLHAVQGQIAAQPGLDNVIQGCPLLMVLKKQIYPSTGQADYEIPGRTIRNQNFGHPTTVAATMNSQTQTWSVAPQQNHKLRCVVRVRPPVLVLR